MFPLKVTIRIREFHSLDQHGRLETEKKIVSHPYPRPHRTVECRARTAHLASPTAGRVSSWNLQWAREPEDGSKPWCPGQFRYGFTVQWNSFGLIQIKSLKKVMTSKDKYWWIWMQWIRPHLTTMVGSDGPAAGIYFLSPPISPSETGDWCCLVWEPDSYGSWIIPSHRNPQYTRYQVV
jgi:hypothetical protein